MGGKFKSEIHHGLKLAFGGDEFSRLHLVVGDGQLDVLFVRLLTATVVGVDEILVVVENQSDSGWVVAIWEDKS